MTDKETNEVMNSGDLWETEAKTNPCHERWNARQLYILCVGCEQQEWMGKDLLGSLKRTQDLGSDPNNEGKTPIVGCIKNQRRYQKTHILRINIDKKPSNDSVCPLGELQSNSSQE